MIKIGGKNLITEKEAASLYGYSISWFQKRRLDGDPPSFFKFEGKGKVFYDKDVLDKWFAENMKEEI